MNSDKIMMDVFRYNKLGSYVCFIDYGTNFCTIPFDYNDYYNAALQNFVNSLHQFENMKTVPVSYNAQLLQIFTNFFVCFEQFVSMLHIILYFYKKSKEIPNKKIQKEFRQDYGETINKIFEIIGNNQKEFYQTGLINKIKEMANVRNYIVHGNIGQIKIQKTQFPEIPRTINYQDIMNQLDFIINFITFFRYVIPKIDLMPQISIWLKETVLFKSLDEYFYNVLCPYMERIMNKHNLKFIQKYSLIAKPIDSVTSEIAQNVFIAINPKQDAYFNLIEINNKNTNYYNEILCDFLDVNEVERLLRTNTFQLPKFMRE